MGWTLEHSEYAAVPASSVFALYAEPATWSQWGHSARWARASGPLADGSVVEVKAAYGVVYRCRVISFVPDERLHLEVRPLGLRIVNRYGVAATADGTLVRHAFDVSGPLAGPARVLAGLYARQLREEARAVIALAARGAS